MIYKLHYTYTLSTPSFLPPFPSTTLPHHTVYFLPLPSRSLSSAPTWISPSCSSTTSSETTQDNAGVLIVLGHGTPLRTTSSCSANKCQFVTVVQLQLPTVPRMHYIRRANPCQDQGERVVGHVAANGIP